ncbi:hypothetical protein F5B18DRAFT_654684 [Nemania serpens]|nr:hypothetical protein F5B18DRAFT_654684 [Nemania serpens]
MNSTAATGANASQQPVNLTRMDKLRKHIKDAAKMPKELVKASSKKVAKTVVNWATKAPLRQRVGDHPAWPGYMGAGNDLDCKLKKQAYDAKTIVENTITGFYPMTDDRNLTPRQLKVRSDIKSLFRATRCKSTYGSSEIKPFVRLFDQFFFFGSLTSRSKRRICACVWEMDSPLLSSCVPSFMEPNMPWGFTRDRYVRGYGPVCEVHIAGQSFYEQPQPLSFFLETLVHEMVHAYLNVHMCRCAHCTGNTLNTAGLTGHGPSFLMVLDCIDQTLKSWGIGLTGMANERLVVNGAEFIFDEVHMLLHAETKHLNNKMRLLGGRGPHTGQVCTHSHGMPPPRAVNHPPSFADVPRLPKDKKHLHKVRETRHKVRETRHKVRETRHAKAKTQSPPVREPRPCRDGPPSERASPPRGEGISRASGLSPPQIDPNRIRPALAERSRPGLPQLIGTPTVSFYIAKDKKRKNKKKSNNANKNRNGINGNGRRAVKKWAGKVGSGGGMLIALKLKDRRDLTQREPGMDVYMISARVGGTMVERARLDAAGDAVQSLLAAQKERKERKERGWGWGRPYRWDS